MQKRRHGGQGRGGAGSFMALTRGEGWQPYLAAICASSSLQEGEQTGCDLPNSFLDLSMARGRCLPQRKQDIVAAPKDEVAANGEPGALER
ncbi:hypothetical protein ASC95_09875 [Pelomonas sp. Root1217]|nr:hypothetical protein ASC95_09875 [Pelomonas sp. Root1217]